MDNGVVWMEIRAFSLKTNDMVRIEGSFKLRDRQLRVNSALIALSFREFIFLAILGRALKNRKGAEPDELPEFLPVDQILAQVDELLRQEGLEEKWKYPVPQDIYDIVYDLRKKFVITRINPHLIENDKRGTGYRISTRPDNLEMWIKFAADKLANLPE